MCVGGGGGGRAAYRQVIPVSSLMGRTGNAPI